jgi:hypothetical protein
VGSRIVAGMFLTVLVNDHDSYLRRRGVFWRPDPAIAGLAGDARMRGGRHPQVRGGAQPDVDEVSGAKPCARTYSL